jgi:hypothetical protein
VELGRETVKTYRYVRVSIVAAVIVLFTALIVQILRDGGVIESSISAYYYTPVRNVFVACLVSAAFLLVAIRGRPGGENTLLDLAAMLLPLVAFIPTPIKGTPESPCTGGEKCIPNEFIPGVEVSITALLVLGLMGLIFTAWTLATEESADPADIWGFVAACAVWLVFAFWFGPSSEWGPREYLLHFGHYAAAIPMFGLIVVVALINARQSDRHLRIVIVRTTYKRVYRLVAYGMGVVLGVASAYWLFVIRSHPDSQHSVVFWVEALLLALFAVFWVAQTAEFWNDGVPDER